MAKEMKKRKQTVDMTSGSITKPLILFILPIIGSGVLQLLYNTVDFIYVGNLLNKTSAAAVGASSTLIFCCIGLFSGIAVGTSVVVSQALGAHNGKDAGKALHTSIAFSLLGGAVLMLLAIAFAPEILKLLNTPGRAMEEAVAYMRIYMLSTPAMIYYNVCSGAIRAAGDSRTPFCILAVCGVVNVAADAVFLIIIPLGVAGVAIATAIAQVLSAVLITRALCRGESSLKLELGKLRIDSDMLKRVLSIGLPTGIQTVLITVSNVMVQYHINAFDETAVAAFATYYKVESFVYLPITAFGQAATTFAGQNTGAVRYDRVRTGCRMILIVCIITTVLLAGIVLLFPKTVFGWVMKDDAVVAETILIASISFPFYWFYSFQEVYGGAIRGMGNAVGPMAVIIGNLCVLRLLLLEILSRVVGTLQSIAAVYPLTWGGTALCFIVLYAVTIRGKTEIVHI